MSQIRIRSSDAPTGLKVGWGRRLISASLYPVFSALLLIPWLRRQRRGPYWQRVRVTAALVGCSVAAAGFREPAAVAAGCGLIALSWLLTPLEDPDRIRKIAEGLGAPHVVNGGFYEAGDLPAARSKPLLLFLSERELLAAAADDPARILARYSLAEIRSIRLEDEEYRPRYVSFAKEPPRLDQNANPADERRVRIDFGSSRLDLRYRGVFAGHLAEVAARTVFEMKKAKAASMRVISG